MFSPSSDINPCLFLVGVICGAIWGSFPLRDHLQHRLRSGIICCPRIICGPRRTERRTEEGGQTASNKTQMIKQLKMASLLVEISSKTRRKIFGKVSSKIEKNFISFSLLTYDFFNEIFGIPKLFAHSCVIPVRWFDKYKICNSFTL